MIPTEDREVLCTNALLGALLGRMTNGARLYLEATEGSSSLSQPSTLRDTKVDKGGCTSINARNPHSDSPVDALKVIMHLLLHKVTSRDAVVQLSSRTKI